MQERVELQLFPQGGVTKLSRHFKSVSVREVANNARKCGFMCVKGLMLKLVYHKTVSQKCHVNISVVIVIAYWCVLFHVGVTKVSRYIKLVA